VSCLDYQETSKNKTNGKSQHNEPDGQGGPGNTRRIKAEQRDRQQEREHKGVQQYGNLSERASFRSKGDIKPESERNSSESQQEVSD